MITIDQAFLDQLTSRARQSPRGRMNHNFHPDDGFCCHRLLNAIEPGSYIRPHRHLEPTKDETFVILRGRLAVITFDGAGDVASSVVLTPAGETMVADVPHGYYHAAVSLAPGTVFFEAKAGPYRPLTEKEFAPWSPPEGSPAAAAYLERLTALLDR